jgi:hypothetical protein
LESGTNWNADRWKTRFGKFVGKIGVQELALALGVDKATVYNWFSGHTEPRREMAERIVALANKGRRKRPLFTVLDIHTHSAAAKSSRRPAQIAEVTDEA